MSGVYEVRTRSGSKYLVDTNNSTVQRVCGGDHYTGTKTPTKYVDSGPLKVGYRMVFEFPDNRELLTSPVTSITEL